MPAGVDAWLKWLAGIAAVVVGAPVLLLYALYWKGARHLPPELPQASRSYSDATRALYWRALSGRDVADIEPLNPVTLVWAVYKLDQHGQAARDRQHPAYATLSRAAQLAYFSLPETPRHGHLEQAALLIRYSRERSADQTVDFILDRSPYGGSVHGLEAAAQRNFGRTASELSPGQTLALLVTLKGPSTYAPQCHPEPFRKRYAHLATQAGLPVTPRAIDDVMRDLQPIDCR